MLDKNGVKDAHGKQANNGGSDNPIAKSGRTVRDVFMSKIVPASISSIAWIVVWNHLVSPSLFYPRKEGGAIEFFEYFFGGTLIASCISRLRIFPLRFHLSGKVL